MDKGLMKGSIDIILLSLIEKRDMYGYEIAKTLKEKSDYSYQMHEGTLYSALQRLKKQKLVIYYWGESETAGRRKYYKITDQGKRQLKDKLDMWIKLNNLIRICTDVNYGGI